MNDGFSGHRARKRFGQNFLHDQSIIYEMVRVFAPQQGQNIVEIGPGQGALTIPLLEAVGEITAIELDRDLIEPLQKLADQYGQLNLIQSDVLQVDFKDLFPDQPIRIIGNLPYNISTPLIFHLLKTSQQIQDMQFLLQREVVNRLTAEPGTKAWGRLSVMSRIWCEAWSVLEVPPTAFTPKPKVDSSVVQLQPRQKPLASKELLPTLKQIVLTAFSARRKAIRNGLKQYISADQLKEIGLDPGLRPQNLSTEDYIEIAQWVKS
ncbi:MAG: 16S rRNA (adenine(1518)-N(6)/adenine(1519)-N(6))-dimethyltransferase RsmA [bacterium]